MSPHRLTLRLGIQHGIRKIFKKIPTKTTTNNNNKKAKTNKQTKQTK